MDFFFEALNFEKFCNTIRAKTSNPKGGEGVGHALGVSRVHADQIRWLLTLDLRWKERSPNLRTILIIFIMSHQRLAWIRRWLPQTPKRVCCMHGCAVVACEGPNISVCADCVHHGYAPCVYRPSARPCDSVRAHFWR